MLNLNAVDLVDIWEQGHLGGFAECADSLLCRAHQGLTRRKLDVQPLGVRNDMLLQLREQVFGPRVESVVDCPQCHESLEIDIDTQQLRADLECNENSPMEWRNGDLWISFRVPTRGDLRSLEGSEDSEEVRRRLLERCVMEARRDGELIESSRLSRQETIALAEQVEQADPRAEIMLKTQCPNCGQGRSVFLDLASFLWHELDMCVKRLLTEVHALAWAYSWSEREILTMSAQRRRFYLGLLGR